MCNRKQKGHVYTVQMYIISESRHVNHQFLPTTPPPPPLFRVKSADLMELIIIILVA